MYIRLTGMVLIVAGCGGYGVMLARNHRREVRALHQLVSLTEQMVSELEYSLSPLPELCRFAAKQGNGSVQSFFLTLAETLESQVSPDVAYCTDVALNKNRSLPKSAQEQLRSLGQTLGRFDLTGQITSLQRCKQACLSQLEILEHQQSQRLRSYQTLGFCCGAALAILLY